MALQTPCWHSPMAVLAIRARQELAGFRHRRRSASLAGSKSSERPTRMAMFARWISADAAMAFDDVGARPRAVANRRRRNCRSGSSLAGRWPCSSRIVLLSSSTTISLPRLLSIIRPLVPKNSTPESQLYG